MPEQPVAAVRAAVLADLPSIMTLDLQVSSSPWSQAALTRYCDTAIADSFCALVFEQAGQVIGFLIYSRVLDEANIDNLAVDPAYQGRGLGRVLLRAALEQMRSLALARCMLEVSESNVAARALYKNNGFVIDGVRPRYYKTAQGREDALLMSRRL